MTDFTVDFFPQGDEGSSFRMQNAPGEQNPANLIDRGSTLNVKGTLVEVLHGKLTPDGVPATLLVLEFHFVSNPKSRGFRQSTMTLQFADAGGNSRRDPEVHRIAPHGAFSMNKTASSQQISLSAHASVQAGLMMVGGGAGFKWESTEMLDDEDRPSLMGNIRVVGRSWGAADAAIWSMTENSRKKDAIPTFLRTAVLLARKADVPFKFTIDITAKMDLASSYASLLHKKPVVDPVEFDPKTPSRLGDNARQVDLEDMKGLDLRSYGDVLFSTPLEVSAM
ncbi:hypothetical protein MMC18_005289 [Xylographa bjoerkii]|nr:hypothetical protein [Xylographa bjoerkii]